MHQILLLEGILIESEEKCSFPLHKHMLVSWTILGIMFPQLRHWSSMRCTHKQISERCSGRRKSFIPGLRTASSKPRTCNFMRELSKLVKGIGVVTKGPRARRLTENSPITWGS